MDYGCLVNGHTQWMHQPNARLFMLTLSNSPLASPVSPCLLSPFFTSCATLPKLRPLLRRDHSQPKLADNNTRPNPNKTAKKLTRSSTGSPSEEITR